MTESKKEEKINSGAPQESIVDPILQMILC
jgi:hypothetical protein